MTMVNSTSPVQRPTKATVTWLNRGLALILLAVLIYFFWPLLGELKVVAGLFRTAIWTWLVMALLIQVVSYGSLTWLNSLALGSFTGKIGFGQLAAVLTSMAFIQIAIPSAGLSGVALRVRLLRKFGYGPEESLFSLAVETTMELIALLSVASLGILYLLRSGNLSNWDLLSYALGTLIGVGVLWYLWRQLRNRDRSKVLLNALIRAWNRYGSRIRRLDINHWEVRMLVFQENIAKFRGRVVLELVLAAYGKVLLDVLTLGACFYLFNYRIAPGTLYTGYGLILAFSSVTALPGGIGMADVYVPVVFSWLNVPGAVALAAGLTYRLIAFWLVRFVGFICWQFLENRY